MWHHGPQPDTTCLNAGIGACARAGNLGGCRHPWCRFAALLKASRLKKHCGWTPRFLAFQNLKNWFPGFLTLFGCLIEFQSSRVNFFLTHWRLRLGSLIDSLLKQAAGQVRQSVAFTTCSSSYKVGNMMIYQCDTIHGTLGQNGHTGHDRHKWVFSCCWRKELILYSVLVALLAMPAVVEEYQDPLRWRCGKLQIASI